MSLVFSTDNGANFNTKLEPGRCFGMSTDWAINSLKLGGVRSADQLNMGAVDMYQSRYELVVFKSGLGSLEQHSKVISDARLSIINANGAGEYFKGVSAQFVANQLFKYFGTCIWAVNGPGGGHAMGFRQTKGAYEYLDPNEGLQLFDSVEGCKSAIASDLANEYPDLCENLYVFHVKL